jgi:diguanylate cyclase (GGDEF)-like protein/PAS domain S-box-containing protein
MPSAIPEMSAPDPYQPAVPAARPPSDEGGHSLSVIAARQAEALRLAGIGNWELGLITGRLYWSDLIFEIFEIDPARFPASYEAFLERVHPDDRAAVDTAYRASVRDHASYAITHRLLMPDGRVKHVHERGETFYDAAGRPIRSIGTVQDVTERAVIEEELRRSRAALAEAQRIAQLGSWSLDLESGAACWSDQEFRCLGYEPDACAPTYENFMKAVHPADVRTVHRAMASALEGPGDHYEAVHRVVWPDGSERVLRQRAAVIRDADGRAVRMIGTTLDVTDQVQAESRLRQAASVFSSTEEGVVITDPDGVIIDVNAAFTGITGYSRAEAIGNTPRLLRSDRQDAAFYAALWGSLNATGRWQGEIWNRRKSGEIYPEWLTINAVRDERGELVNFVAVFSDISGIKQSQAQLAHLAHHDPLTGLPNRLLFADRLGHALSRAQRDGSQLALLFIDLDRFKHINDSLGHLAGDGLLQEVARRFTAAVRREDTVARMGGDEFTLLLEDLRRPEDAAVLARKLLDALADPYTIAGRDLFVTASVGISLFPRDGATADELVRNADAAMYQAKDEGRNGYHFYRPELTATALQRVHLEADLRRALARGELTVHYQPQIDLGTGRLIGAEALVRWHHPEQGPIPPDRFIHLAEDTGLIIELGELVLRAACRQAVEWLASGVPIERIAVNVSAHQVQRSDFVATVRRALAETGLPPRHLELEVTESFIMGQAEAGIRALHALREMGLRLAVDDFGTGYSSLGYLKRLPIHMLKIDRSFVSNLDGDAEDLAIAKAIIALGRTLGLKVIAEGVEHDRQAGLLRAEGCHYGQGYLFGRPVEGAAFARRWAPEPPALRAQASL